MRTVEVGEGEMFYSTKFNKGEKDKLVMFSNGRGKSEIKPITKKLSGYSNISIISCFYGKNFLDRLLDQLPQKNCKTNIIVSSIGSSNKKLKSIISDLLEVKVHQTQRILLYVCRDVSMLHTKLYLAYNKKRRASNSCCLVGSANLSDKAFNLNEEILVDITDWDDKERAYNYFQKIKESAFDISKHHKKYIRTRSDEEKNAIIYEILREINDGEVKKGKETVFEFLNAGFLAFRANKNFSIGLSTSNDWKTLVKGISDQLPSVISSHSIDVADILGVKNLDYNDSEPEKKGRKNRFGIKTYSIETCFGYWVPRGYFYKEVDDILFNRSNRKDDYEKIYKALEENSQSLTQNAETRFNRLFDAIIEKKTIIETDVVQKERIKTDILQKKDSIREELIKHIQKKKIFYKKYKKDYLQRGYYLSPMPYIWDDVPSVNDFLDSFAIGRSYNVNERSILIALNKVLYSEIDEEKLHEPLKDEWDPIDEEEYNERKKRAERSKKRPKMKK